MADSTNTIDIKFAIPLITLVGNSISIDSDAIHNLKIHPNDI